MIMTAENWAKVDVLSIRHENLTKTVRVQSTEGAQFMIGNGSFDKCVLEEMEHYRTGA